MHLVYDDDYDEDCDDNYDDYDSNSDILNLWALFVWKVACKSVFWVDYNVMVMTSFIVCLIIWGKDEIIGLMLVVFSVSSNSSPLFRAILCLRMTTAGARSSSA